MPKSFFIARFENAKYMTDANKISLRNIDLIVSYREATLERRENLYTVLAHLGHTYTDYRLWLHSSTMSQPACSAASAASV